MLYDLAIYIDEADDPDYCATNLDRMRSRRSLFSSAEAAAVVSVLTVIRDNASISDWDRESIDRTLNLVWRADE